MYTRHIDTQHDTHRLHNRPMSRGSALETWPSYPTSLDPIEITRFNTDDSGVHCRSNRMDPSEVEGRRKASEIGLTDVRFARPFLNDSNSVVGSDLEIGEWMRRCFEEHLYLWISISFNGKRFNWFKDFLLGWWNCFIVNDIMK